jgi:hypothetical protein
VLSLRGDFNFSLRSSDWLRVFKLWWVNRCILVKRHAIPLSCYNPVPDWNKLRIGVFDILNSVVFRRRTLVDEEHFLSIDIFRIKLLHEFIGVIHILQKVFFHVGL